MRTLLMAGLLMLLAAPASGQEGRLLTASPEVACEQKEDALKLARLLSDTARVDRQHLYYRHAREWVLEGRCVQLESGRWVTVSKEDAESGLVRITPAEPWKITPDTVWARWEALRDPDSS